MAEARKDAVFAIAREQPYITNLEDTPAAVEQEEVDTSTVVAADDAEEGVDDAVITEITTDIADAETELAAGIDAIAIVADVVDAAVPAATAPASSSSSSSSYGPNIVVNVTDATSTTVNIGNITVSVAAAPAAAATIEPEPAAATTEPAAKRYRAANSMIGAVRRGKYSA